MQCTSVSHSIAWHGIAASHARHTRASTRCIQPRRRPSPHPPRHPSICSPPNRHIYTHPHLQAVVWHYSWCRGKASINHSSRVPRSATSPLSLAPSDQASAARRQAQQHTELRTTGSLRAYLHKLLHFTRTALTPISSPINDTLFRRSCKYSDFVVPAPIRGISRNPCERQGSYRGPHLLGYSRNPIFLSRSSPLSSTPTYHQILPSSCLNNSTFRILLCRHSFDSATAHASEQCARSLARSRQDGKNKRNLRLPKIDFSPSISPVRIHLADRVSDLLCKSVKRTPRLVSSRRLLDKGRPESRLATSRGPVQSRGSAARSGSKHEASWEQHEQLPLLVDQSRCKI